MEMRSGCAGLPMLFAVSAIGGAAQAQPVRFDVPAQPLAGALARFADAAGVQILFDPAVVRGHTSTALHGTLPVDTALARLLAGTGLDVVRSGARVYLVVARRARPAPRPVPRAPAPPPPPPPPPIEAIVVTAARHQQSLQRVSATVDVVRGPDIAAQAITSATGALEAVTGVSTTSQPGGVSINIRGLGADMPSGSTQGSVALEFDGIYSIIALGTETGFFDVDRVEVVKGPQSTRYGPNAEGGIVNVISRDPVLGDLSGGATLTMGSADLVRAEAEQTVPLGPTLALRVAGAAIRRNSWFTPALADTVAQSGRIKLLYAPSTALTVKLAWQVDHIGGTGSGSEAGYPILISHVAPYAGDSINATGNPWAQGDRADGSYDPASSRANLIQSAVSGAVTWQPGSRAALDVTAAHLAIGGTQTSCARSGSPWEVSGPGECYGVHEFAPFDQTMAEVRLHSPDRSSRAWNLGLYFWEFGKTSWAEAYQAVAGPAGAEHVGTRTFALFGEITQPVTPRLRLILGGRESWDHRVLRPSGVATSYTADFAHADVRLGEEYDLAPAVMQYATLATGYRPGGLSYDGSTGTAAPFASEQTLAWEAGLKATLWHDRLRLNLGGFVYRQRDYQDLDTYNGYTVLLASGQPYVCGASGGQPPACSLPSFTIPRASNIGLEWQARLSPDPADRLTVNGTMMRARFGNDIGTCATIAAPTTPGCWIGYNDQITGALHFFRLNGAVQPHSPTLSLTIGYQHDLALPSGWRLTPGMTAEHASSYWVGPVEDAQLLGFQPGYWLWNLNLHLVPPTGRIEFTAWIKNLRNYAVKMSTLPAPTIGDPRNFGLSAGLHW
jgi:iron complex outermembrane recepter protein